MLTLLTACVATTPVHADTIYRFVANFSAGAATDTLARALALAWRDTETQAMVDNIAGANGNIGAASVARSAPDGTTLLVTPDLVVTANPALYRNTGFDVASLTPIGMLSLQPSVLTVRAGSPIRSVVDFVAHARKRALTYASAGVGSGGHLTMGYFADAARLKMTHVPYKGGAPALVALLAGEVDAAFMVLGNSLPNIRQGRVTALAVSSERRSPQLPEVPTIVEAGYPGFVVNSGNMVMVPLATPAPIHTRLEARLRSVTGAPPFQAVLDSLGMQPASLGSKDTADWLAHERTRWAQVIRERGITLD